MRVMWTVVLCQVVLWSSAAVAIAQDNKGAPGTPGVITGGSANTSIGGQAAARRGDTTSESGDSVVGGSNNVFINGKPAATAGDKTGCGGVALGGGSGVYINGKPAARAGDLTTGCPGK